MPALAEPRRRDRRTDQRMKAGGSQSGAALVFAMFAVATLVSLALAASVASRGRVARAASRIGRAALRDAAENALVLELRKIEADTNAVDCLSEPWALDSAAAAEALAAGGDGVFVTVSDERARLGVPDCGEKTLAALLSLSSGLDAASAAGLAHASLPEHPSHPASPASPSGPASPTSPASPSSRLPCEEFLLAGQSGVADRAALEAAMPFLSASAGAAFNVNTAPRPVVVAAALGGGATPGGAEGLWLRLEMARRRGDVFASASPAEAMKLLRGEGDVPTSEELEALSLVQPFLRVDSGLFRVESTARRGRLSATVACVYERGTGRIFRWTSR